MKPRRLIHSIFQMSTPLRGPPSKLRKSWLPFLMRWFVVLVTFVLIYFSFRRVSSQRKEEESQKMPSKDDSTASSSACSTAVFEREVLERLVNPKLFFRTPADAKMPQGRLFLDLRTVSAAFASCILTAESSHPLSRCVDNAFSAALSLQRKSAASSDPQEVGATEQVEANRKVFDSIVSITDSEETETRVFPLHTVIGGLDFGSNNLSSLTADLLRFSQLEVLFLTDNKFTHAPPVVAKIETLNRLSLKSNLLESLDPQRELPPQIMHLILTENRIAQFHSSFCGNAHTNSFGGLRKLMLSGNRISSWTDMFYCAATGAPQPNDKGSKDVFGSLELLRVSRNEIDSVSFASSRLSHPFKHLSWASFAGNPFLLPPAVVLASGRWTPKDITDALSPMVDLTGRVQCRSLPSSSGDARVGVLGEGASGIVKRCVLDSETLVAVKFFKRVSSDGSGADEILALAQVPRHANIVAPIGYVRFPSMSYVVAEGILPESRAPGMHRFTPPNADETDDQVGEVVGVCFPLVHAEPLARPPTIWTVSDDIFETKTTGGILHEWWSIQVPPPIDAAAASHRYWYAELAVWLSLKLISGILAATRRLHEPDVQLMHGDIYAHNMFFGTIERSADLSSRSTEEDVLTARINGHIRNLDNNRTSLSLLSTLPSAQRWVASSVFLTDFGASFHYGPPVALPDTVKTFLRATEVSAFMIFVRDVFESITPLVELGQHIWGADWDATASKDDLKREDGNGDLASRLHSIRHTFGRVKSLLERDAASLHDHHRHRPSSAFIAVEQLLDFLLSAVENNTVGMRTLDDLHRLLENCIVNE